MRKRRPSQDGEPGAAKRRAVVFRRFMFSNLPRWKCWTCRAGVGLPLFLVLGLVVLTQTVLLKRMVIPPLEAELGLKISAGWVHVGRGGDLVMQNVQVRTPSVPGPAGMIVQVGVLRADVDWWSVLRGKPRLTEVRLVDPLVRLSQSVDDETLNLAGIPAPPVATQPGAPGAPMVLPRIIGTRIALELGEHQGETYTILKRLNLEGSLVPAGGVARQYDVRLHETAPRRGRRGITLSGSVYQSGLDVELAGVTLNDWSASVVPTPVREWFRRLDLEGDVASTRFVARNGKWASVTLELADVGVNLPLEKEPKEGAPGATRPPMRMSGVSGEIQFTPAGVKAELKGNVEDLPYTVTLNVDGLDINSAFQMDVVSENFQIAKNPDLLPYAPALVKKRFRSFSSPTGEVDTRMTVTRGPPTADGPAPVQVSGLINVSHVNAAYDKFPYRFPDLSGLIRFDDKSVDIVQVSGTAPSGAKVFATGRIAPLGPDAEVKLDIDVTDMPLDEGIQDALGPQRGDLIPALFNREKYQALVAAGLVLTPAHAQELRKELERRRVHDPEKAGEIERQLLAPAFDLGGVGRVHVNLHRPLGDNSDWFTVIDVYVPQAGILVGSFPLPILAHDIALHIDDERADLTAGTFRPLTGGSADISMTALLHDPATGEKDFRPDVSVWARDVPVDPLFLAALPRGADAPDGRGIVQSILQGLGVDGLVDATAHIVHRPTGPLGFDVHVDLAKTELAPPPGEAEAPLRVIGLVGAAYVSEERLDLSLEGSLRIPVADPDAADQAAGRVSVGARITYGGEGADRRWAYDATITGAGLDASAPVEGLVRAFSASTAGAMAERRIAWRPVGNLDAVTRVTGSSQSPVAAEVAISRASGVELDLLGARAALSDAEGSTVFHLGGDRGVTAEFRGVRSALSFDGEEAGVLSLNGVYDFSGGAATDLSAEVTGGRFESALTRRIVRERLGVDAGAWWEGARPRGQYDQQVSLRSGPGSSVLMTGVLSPHTFAYLIPADRGPSEFAGPPLEVSFDAVEGQVRFSPTGGEVVGLKARAPEWAFSGDGQWTLFGGGEYSAGGRASLEADRLPSDLRAMLPEGVRHAMDALAVRADGPVSLENGRFSIARRSSPVETPGGALERGTEQTADYSGTVSFQNAGLEAGVKVSRFDGFMDFEATQLPGKADAPGLQYSLKVRGNSLLAAGVSMTDAKARIVSGDAAGEVIVPFLSARCHGGRVVGRGHAWPGAPSSAQGEPQTEYETSVQWSGLRFAPMMADLTAAMSDAPPDAPPEAPSPPAEEDLSRGVFEGELSLAGVAAVDSARRGRGTMRVSGGRVLKFPLVLQLIEVSNLAPPVNAALDYARASLLIDGPRIVFEDVSIFSSAVSILGYGTMSWPETELDLRFRSRAAKPIPILSQIVSGLRDELISTSVKGTLAHPSVSLQRFPETRRLIDRAMGQAPTGEERTMDEIERRSRETDSQRAPDKSESVSPSGSGGQP